jgi:hypothetical protein
MYFSPIAAFDGICLATVTDYPPEDVGYWNVAVSGFNSRNPNPLDNCLIYRGNPDSLDNYRTRPDGADAEGQVTTVAAVSS